MIVSSIVLYLFLVVDVGEPEGERDGERVVGSFVEVRLW